MAELLRWFLIVAGILAGVTLIVLLAFPVEVYERSKRSSMRDATKGLFAQTVNSLYQVRRYGLDAEPKYWWHLVWFNAAASAGISLVVTTGVFLVVGLVIAVLAIIAIFIALGMLSNS